MSNIRRELVPRDLRSNSRHPFASVNHVEYLRYLRPPELSRYMLKQVYRIMSSEPFKIIIESSANTKTEYYIHSELFASLSPSLNALVHGGMREAQEKCVTWNMRRHLFACFMAFAYTGKYETPNYHACMIAEKFGSKCIDTDTVHESCVPFGQSVMHIDLMIFADYRDIRALYEAALCQLKVTLGHPPLTFLVTEGRALLIQLLGKNDAPVHVARDVMQVVVHDAKVLWNNKRCREALEQWPDLKSEFLDLVMSNAGNNAR